MCIAIFCDKATLKKLALSGGSGATTAPATSAKERPTPQVDRVLQVLQKLDIRRTDIDRIQTPTFDRSGDVFGGRSADGNLMIRADSSVACANRAPLTTQSAQELAEFALIRQLPCAVCRE